MMKLNNLLIGNLIFIFLLVSVYFLYTNLSTENNTIVSYMNDINSEQFNDNVSFNDKELYTIANIHHYGRYHNSIDVNKAIDMNVDVVDMEAYAIAKICKLEKIEFQCFKYISDKADNNADTDWKKNLEFGAKAFSDFIDNKVLMKSF